MRGLASATVGRLLLLTIAFSFSTAHATTRSVDLDVDASSLRVVSDAGEPVFVLPGSHALRHVGRPELPALSFDFAVDQGMSVVNARLVGGTWVPSPVAERPRTVRPLAAFEARGFGEERAFDEAALDGATVYPPVTARAAGEVTWHGQNIASVEAFPVRVGANGALEVLEGARLEVEFASRGRVEDVARRQRALDGWTDRIELDVRMRVVNPGDVRVDAPARVGSTPLSAPASASAGPSLESAPVRHLILTTSPLETAFQRLADHRNQLGMPSLVVTLDDVLAQTRQGVDLAETIRNYVRDAYELWGVDYLLIGGDTDLIPTRYVRNTFYPSGSFTDIPTDLYYGGLDGNWNDDGDALFGEHYRSSVDRGDDVDFAAEVAVGRAPVVTPAGANAFVDKVLAYEIPASTDWQKRSLFASEVLFPLGWKDGEPFQLDGAFLSESLIDSAFGCGEPWDIERQYERPEAYPGATDVSPSLVVDALDTGQYGVFHHVGHGFYFNMSVGPAALVPADADGLTNAPNYFLLYSLNCSSSAYDFNCLNERFVSNPNGGAMASLGSSRAAFPSAAKPLQEKFYQAWLCDEIDRLGDVVTASREPFLFNTLYNTVQRWTQMVYATLGDPAMRLYRDFPIEAQILAADEIDMGETGQPVFVVGPGSTPIEGVTVSARKDGEDFFVGTTDANGQITLDFRAETPGAIELWASGAQIVPTSRSIAVPTGIFARASVSGLALGDGGAPADGNGNGRVEAGERISVLPTVRNPVGVTHPGGAMTLQVDDPFVTIVDDTAAFGSIPAQGSVAANDAFVLDIATDTPDGHRIDLRISVPDGQGTPVLDEELLTVAAAAVEVVEISFDDGGDGTVGNGETVDVIVRVKNYGSGATGVIDGTMVATSGDATVLDADGSWPGAADVLASTSNDADVFTFQAGTDLANTSFEITLTDAEGRSIVHGFDVVAPSEVSQIALAGAGSGQIQIEWEKPGDADLFGYRVYRRPLDEPEFELATPDVLVGSSTFFDSGLAPLTTFVYTVSAVDQGGLEGPLSDALAASTNPPELDCFPLPMGLETSGALAISEVNDDQQLDMIIGSETIYVIDGECQEPLDGDDDAQTFGPIYDIESRFGPSSITLGELDPSRVGLEIVAFDRDAQELLVMDDRGNLLPGWPRSLANWAWSTPVVGDVDNDGTLGSPDNEIVINDLNGFTYVFHHDGTELADGDSNPSTIGPIAPRRVQNVGGVDYFESFGRTTPALYDVDGNGTLEILFGSKYQNANAPEFFYALRVDAPGQNAAGWPKQFDPRSEFLASPTIADLDGDGNDEIIAISENDNVYVWETDGTPQPGFPKVLVSNSVNFNSLTPSPAVGNFDADTDLEFVAVGINRVTIDNKQVYQSLIHVFDPDGTVLPGWPVIVDDLSESSPVVGDVDGDGSLDVVYGIGGNEADDALFAFDAAGQPIRGFPIPINGFVRATPTLIDFDRNGTLDLALATWDRQIHVWDTGAPYDPDLVPWPTFRGNVNRTGVFAQKVATSAPGGDGPVGVRRSSLASAVPNPFNPQTKIAFALSSDATDVRLNVYDAQGRHVRTLARGTFGAGEHAVVWSGDDAQGNQVASGVYFAVLEVDGERIDSRKMALIK